MPLISAVVFDIDETIVSEGRQWSDWAEWLDVPHHTVSALVGAIVAQGGNASDALRLIRPGLDVWAEYQQREQYGLGDRLDDSDLYPDVRAGLQALRDAGLWVGIAGDTGARIGAQLRELDLPADGVATAGEWGVMKPHRGFFECVQLFCGRRPAEEILYVGDHPDDDIAAAQQNGLKACHIRRGPWGLLRADQPEAVAADFRIDSIAELPRLLRTAAGVSD